MTTKVLIKDGQAHVSFFDRAGWQLVPDCNGVIGTTKVKFREEPRASLVMPVEMYLALRGGRESID